MCAPTSNTDALLRMSDFRACGFARSSLGTVSSPGETWSWGSVLCDCTPEEWLSLAGGARRLSEQPGSNS